MVSPWSGLLLTLLAMFTATRAFVPTTAVSGRSALGGFARQTAVAAKRSPSPSAGGNSASFGGSQAASSGPTSTRLMCSLIGNLFGGGGPSKTTIFDFKVKDAEGVEVKLADYKGQKKAFLIVNVASLTAQNYAELAALYGKYSKRGLEILGFPSNQFGSQEPGTNAEIQAFAKARGATYPIFAKVDVNGFGAIPLYNFLKGKQGGSLGISAIKWNFTKFLCDAEGKPIKRFGPTESPFSFEQDIVALL